MSRENASARPPRIIELMELSPKERKRNVARAESGIDRNTATVARTLPRKTMIINPVRHRPMAPS